MAIFILEYPAILCIWIKQATMNVYLPEVRLARVYHLCRFERCETTGWHYPWKGLLLFLVSTISLLIVSVDLVV